MELQGKNVVYIGGCGGIGSLACELLIQKGVANLAILDLNENCNLITDLNAKSSAKNVFFVKVDVTNQESVEKSLNEVILKIQYFDVLVNGSGIVDDLNPKKTIEVNLLGVIYATTAASDLMDKSKGGRGGLILNIGSISGLDPFVEAPFYSASKAGVVMFSRNLGNKFHHERTGVSVIVVCPGVTDTKMADQFKEEGRTKHVKAINAMLDWIKIQKPEDCARHVIEAIEANKSGTVYVSFDGWIKEIPMQSWYEAAKM